jgi:hypothetical protein
MLLKNTIVAAICGSTFVSQSTFGQEDKIRPDISIAESVHFVATIGGLRTDCAADTLPGYRLLFNRCDGVELSSGSSPKKKSEEDFVAHTFWLQAKGRSPLVRVSASKLDLRTQTSFGFVRDIADSFNSTQRTLPPSKHRGVFYNSATFNINGLRGFTDREQPAILFGYIF